MKTKENSYNVFTATGVVKVTAKNKKEAKGKAAGNTGLIIYSVIKLN